jgi:hypothetical protein
MYSLLYNEVEEYKKKGKIKKKRVCVVGLLMNFLCRDLYKAQHNSCEMLILLFCFPFFSEFVQLFIFYRADCIM